MNSSRNATSLWGRPTMPRNTLAGSGSQNAPNSSTRPSSMNASMSSSATTVTTGSNVRRALARREDRGDGDTSCGRARRCSAGSTVDPSPSTRRRSAPRVASMLPSHRPCARGTPSRRPYETAPLVPAPRTAPVGFASRTHRGRTEFRPGRCPHSSTCSSPSHPPAQVCRAQRCAPDARSRPLSNRGIVRRSPDPVAGDNGAWIPPRTMVGFPSMWEHRCASRASAPRK